MPTKTKSSYVLVMISQFAEFLIIFEKALIGYGLNVFKLDAQLSEKTASRTIKDFILMALLKYLILATVKVVCTIKLEEMGASYLYLMKPW